MVVTPFVRGLLGIEVAAGGRELRFAPQLPADWDRVSVVNIAAGESRYDFQLERSESRMTITASAKSAGGGTTSVPRMVVSPAFPLDAIVRSVTVNGRRMPFKMQQMGDVQQAQVTIDTPSAQTTVQFEYAGGTDVYSKIEAPAPGAENSGLRILRSTATANQLKLVLEGRGGRSYSLFVRTPRRVGEAPGVKADANSWQRRASRDCFRGAARPLCSARNRASANDAVIGPACQRRLRKEHRGENPSSNQSQPTGSASADAVPALSGRGRLPRAGKRSPLILSLRSLPRRVAEAFSDICQAHRCAIAFQGVTDHTEGTRREESLRPFSRARAPCGRSACLAPYGLGRPRPALRDRQPCITIIDCGLRSQTADSAAHAQRAVLASADDRRRSTPMRRAAGTRPEPIPRGDSPPSDPWRSENPVASGAEAYVVVTIP